MTPGEKADATKVRAVLRSPFDRYQKHLIRRLLTKWLRTIELERPILDLWAGGASAEMFVAAGLPVLSIDDGRSRPEELTPKRMQRALVISGEIGGYRTAWGRAARYAGECDAAWLDFCGHWSGEVRRTIEACRHMRAIAVTLMPERLELGSGLLLSEWETAYRALLETTSGMIVIASRSYRREHGNHAFVFMLTPRTLAKSAGCICALESCSQPIPKGRRKYCSTRHRNRAQYERDRAKPEYMTRIRTRAQRPEVRALANTHQKERWHLDLENRRKYAREWQRKKFGWKPRATPDPEQRKLRAQAAQARAAERNRQRYRDDPEYRERIRTYARRQRERNKQRALLDPEYKEHVAVKAREAQRRWRERHLAS